MFDLVGFPLYVLRTWDFKDLSRFHHPIFPRLLKTIEIEDYVGPPKTISGKCIPFWCPGLSKIGKIVDFKNADIRKNGIFKHTLGFSCIFNSILVINNVQGPDLVKMLEVPKMSNKILEHVPKP